MKTGAFFDLDGTVIKGNSGLRYILFLYENNVLKAKKSAIYPGLKLAYSYLKGKYMDAVDQADNLMALAFKGAKKKDAERCADFFVLTDVKNFVKPIIERIRWHKKQKHVLVLLSASPDEVVTRFGKTLGFDYSIGSRFKTKKGIYTGELVTPSMIGKERAIVAKNVSKKLGIDMKESYAYGNCVNDLEILESVKHPFAVNPNKHLAPVARKKGFKIL